MAAKKKIPDGLMERIEVRIDFKVVQNPLDAAMRAHIAKHFPTATVVAGEGNDFSFVFPDEVECRRVTGSLFNDPNTEANSPFLDHLFPGSFDLRDPDLQSFSTVADEVGLGDVKPKSKKRKRKTA